MMFKMNTLVYIVIAIKKILTYAYKQMMKKERYDKYMNVVNITIKESFYCC